MPRGFLTLKEAVAEIDQWIDEGRPHDDPTICILPPEVDGDVSDVEFLDDNEISRKENEEIFPAEVVGALEVEGILSEWEEEDEIPIASLASQPSSTKSCWTGKVKWESMDSTQYTPNSFPKNSEFQAREKLETLFADCTPLQLFEKFFDESIYSMIIQQSNTYAQQKNERNFQLTLPQLKRFLGILLFSGHHPVPQEQLYWSTSPDYDFKIIRNTMPRNLYYKIKWNLHLANNNERDNDKFFKVREFMTKISTNCAQFGIFTQNLSIDESMWPYHGRHSCKMYIKGKPIRFGYKIWCLASTGGYVYRFFPYAGKNEEFDPLMGLGENVVRKLLEIVDEPENHKVYFDNFFTSHRLLANLSKDRFFATGTVRDNRTGKCPLTIPKDFKKKQRGHYEAFCDCSNQCIALRWNDNSVVTFLSNCDAVEPVGEARRFSQHNKSYVKVSCPNTVKKYNENMGGVDLFDRFLSQYRIGIKGKKWWWPLFSNCLDMAVTNAWCLHKKLCEKPTPLLEFRRAITIALLTSPLDADYSDNTDEIPNQRPFRQTSLALLATSRHLGGKHELVKIDDNKRKRCRVCKSQTVFKCGACSKAGNDIPLHVKCCPIFHSRL